MRHRSYLIIVILIVPALPLEWKQQELLRSLVHQKRSMDYITLLFMEMVTARHILLSKTYMVQVNLVRRSNVTVTIKNVSIRGFVIWKKNQNTKGLRRNEKLTNTKIDIMQNYFGIALRSNVGNLSATMRSACMPSMLSASIKIISRTIPTTTNRRMLYPLMLGE